MTFRTTRSSRFQKVSKKEKDSKALLSDVQILMQELDKKLESEEADTLDSYVDRVSAAFEQVKLQNTILRNPLMQNQNLFKPII